MRKVLWGTLFVVTLLTALASYAQSPNYSVGPVWRVTYYRLKPGQGDAFWKDFRENLKPVYDDIKKEGMISDYKVWTNVTTDSPGDWDVAVGLMFPNWAALDQLDAKAATISAKHYGSRDAMIEAGKKRNDLREVVASKLAHEVMPK
jgi:hypothetical protein